MKTGTIHVLKSLFGEQMFHIIIEIVSLDVRLLMVRHPNLILQVVFIFEIGKEFNKDKLREC